MKNLTCSQYIMLILNRGGTWKNRDIEHAILEQYGVQFQNNTIAKYLSFLIKENKVLSRPVNLRDGGICAEYWVVETKADIEKKKNNLRMVSVHEFIVICKKIAKTFPYDHPELVAILEQCRIINKSRSSAEMVVIKMKGHSDEYCGIN